jgi:hypothetical protein
MTVALDNASVEAVARRVVELLRGEDLAEELIDASEVARRFGVDRQWVYQHAQELGAVRLGDGDRPRLRFAPARVADVLTPRPFPLEPKPSPAKRPGRSQRADLLPVGPSK